MPATLHRTLGLDHRRCPRCSKLGDRTDKRQSGANNHTTYDSLFSSGGGMHASVNDYGMSAAISQNGGNYDISISYKCRVRVPLPPT